MNIPNITINNDSNPSATGQESHGHTRRFLDKDHFSEGCVQGYKLHCQDGLDMYTQMLKTQFCLCIDYDIAATGNDLLEEKVSHVELGELLPGLSKTLELRMEHNKGMIEEMKLQKMLSIDSEGWFSTVALTFKSGFNQGLIDFLTENKILTNK
ncbi:MAG: hypothetical protein EOO20_15175 [Chryseobacterium sp.]|nr:MAG: hypothetical protein EOO20_15175 [Chryseobacterium sp.]